MLGVRKLLLQARRRHHSIIPFSTYDESNLRPPRLEFLQVPPKETDQDVIEPEDDKGNDLIERTLVITNRSKK